MSVPDPYRPFGQVYGCTRRDLAACSVTWSAMASIVGGAAISGSVAVLTLMTNRNPVGA
jgi:hypothetical protein